MLYIWTCCKYIDCAFIIEYIMSAQVLLNLYNELKYRNKKRDLASILSRFRKEFNKFNYT